jgi:opacity protein-like surface antigen
MPYFAVEVGYVDSGNPQWDQNFVYIGELADVFNVAVDFTKLTATEVSAIGILPFATIWEAYLRAGVAYWSAEADQTAINSFNRALFFRSVDENDTGFLFGIGIGATPLPHWHLRLELQTYSVSEDLFGGNGDANVESILFEAQYRLNQ